MRKMTYKNLMKKIDEGYAEVWAWSGNLAEVIFYLANGKSRRTMVEVTKMNQGKIYYKIKFLDGTEYSDEEFYHNVKAKDYRKALENGFDMDKIDYISIWDEEGNEY